MGLRSICTFIETFPGKSGIFCLLNVMRCYPLKVYRNSKYHRKLILRRTAIVAGGIAIVAALAVIITLVVRPLTPIPTSSPDAAPSSESPLEPEPSQPEDSSLEPTDVSSAEPDPVSSGTDSSSTTSSSGDGWTPPAPPEDGPSYTKLYPDLYCPPAEEATSGHRLQF